MNKFEIKNRILIAYQGNEKDVTVPSGITAIGRGAFQYCENLRSVAVPEGTLDIGSDAFGSCINLQSVKLPDSLKFISRRAFHNCKSLSDIEIPEGVTYIGDFAFCLCKNLHSISIPNGITEIADNLFWYCTGLQRISIPESVTRIGEGAFLKCNCLSEITIPENVTDIHTSAFYGCERLTVTMNGAPEFKASDFDGVALIVAPKIPMEKFDSPMSKRAAVRGYLENPTLFCDPEIAESYRKYAIRQRTKILTDVFKNDTVSALYFYAQENKIKAANFEEEYLNPAIAENATDCMAFLLDFRNKHISDQAMERAHEKEFTKDPYNTHDMRKIWSYKKCEDGTLSLTAYKGTETYVSIPPYIGNTVVSRLGKFLFAPLNANGKQKTEVIQENLQKIESVFIGENVKTVEQGAFYDCRNLQSVTVPDSVESICSSAFLGCGKLKVIYGVPGSYAEEYAVQNNIPFSAAKKN